MQLQEQVRKMLPQALAPKPVPQSGLRGMAFRYHLRCDSRIRGGYRRPNLIGGEDVKLVEQSQVGGRSRKVRCEHIAFYQKAEHAE
ncbi:MAG: hypothetical protein C0471_15170 [Erythrobacter sp.]|nr:hypothetical protein [Erythrobacter sp.]